MMTAGETYNGWSNYATWNVALWLSNDEGSYNLTREMAREALDEWYAVVQPKRMAAGTLADNLKELVTEAAPDLGASMYADLLGAALSDVDWYEIAENVLSED